uniref:ATP synthase subunit 8 n=1 Tax=Amblyomma breviscutatum TaxID=3134081 RepID=UPI0030FE86C8
MPQLFPMNWCLMTFLMLSLMTIMIMHTYFFKINFNISKKEKNIKNNPLSFKW